MLAYKLCCFQAFSAHTVYRNWTRRKLCQRFVSNILSSKVDPKVLALRDKLLYCDHLDQEVTKMGYLKRRMLEKKKNEYEAQAKYDEIAYQPAFSVILEDSLQEEKKNRDKNTEQDNAKENTKQKPVHMPYSMVDSYHTTETTRSDDTEEELIRQYKDLQEKYLEITENKQFAKNDPDNSRSVFMSTDELQNVPPNWMVDYEQFDDSMLNSTWYNHYGTPDPNVEISSVHCGGCGALLHCKDPAIPGYLPSELFLHKEEEDLKEMVCQRCHFLKFYNTALKVKVSIEDYPKLLSVIKKKKCAIILIIDLTDFPCSIWPDLKSIMHPFTPVFLVGNKVDLLPRDSPKFFDNVKQLLADTVVDVTGINRGNITHVQLASAKTGYGIEQLINKLQHKWRYRGDVYLVGCTNVGKSSLFNTLLGSDYCKINVSDLVQRATVSSWPGTTLNLLKFPILNLSGRKLWLRTNRLMQDAFYKKEEAKYRDYQFIETRDMELATLRDHVIKTFNDKIRKEGETADPFSEKSHKFMLKQPVFDDSDPELKQSRWCYDTPGTIQSDQILDLLTTDELLLTLSKKILSPRTFILKAGQTVFLAGMGRLDYLKGESYIRCTLFASESLPITVCCTVDADQLYQQLLETKAFVVPTSDPKRLKAWPALESKELSVIGKARESVADVVLSSAGWIAITPQENERACLRAWTPQGRGIYVRSPALLKNSVNLHGPRVHGTPMYLAGKQVYVKRV